MQQIIFVEKLLIPTKSEINSASFAVERKHIGTFKFMLLLHPNSVMFFDAERLVCWEAIVDKKQKYTITCPRKLSMESS